MNHKIKCPVCEQVIPTSVELVKGSLTGEGDSCIAGLSYYGDFDRDAVLDARDKMLAVVKLLTFNGALELLSDIMADPDAPWQEEHPAEYAPYVKLFAGTMLGAERFD